MKKLVLFTIFLCSSTFAAIPEIPANSCQNTLISEVASKTMFSPLFGERVKTLNEDFEKRGFEIKIQSISDMYIGKKIFVFFQLSQRSFAEQARAEKESRKHKVKPVKWSPAGSLVGSLTVDSKDKSTVVAIYFKPPAELADGPPKAP